MAASNLNLGKASGGVLNIQPADGTTTTSLVLPAINGTVVAADSSGNVGIGVTPSVWLTNVSSKAIQLGYSTSIASLYAGTFYNNAFLGLTANSYVDASAVPKYIANSYATQYTQSAGTHNWQVAPSGTAGNTITWTNAMTLDASGNLLLQSGTGGLGYGTGAGGQVTQLTSKSTAVTLNKPCGTIVTSSSALAAGATVGFYMYNTLAAYFNVCVIETSSGAYNATAVTENGAVYIKLTNVAATTLSDAVAIRFALIRGANA